MTALPVTPPVARTNWNFVESLYAKDGKFNPISEGNYAELEAAVKGLPITEDVASIFPSGAHLVTRPTRKAKNKPSVKLLIDSKKLIVCPMSAENRLYYTINPGTHTVTIIGKTGGHLWHIGHTAHRDYENEYDDNSYDAAAAMLGYGYNDNHYIDYSNGGQYYLGPPVSNGYNGYNGYNELTIISVILGVIILFVLCLGSFICCSISVYVIAKVTSKSQRKPHPIDDINDSV
eukprot:912219_1